MSTPAPVRRPRRTRRASTAAVGLVVLVGLVGLAGCSDDDGSSAGDPAGSPTGDAIAPATRPSDAGPPGELVEATPIDAPDGARAWRIVFHSRSATSADIAVTGLLVTAAAPSDEARPVVAWGHSTAGTADACAPSLDGVAEIPVASDALTEGWAVVVPDFEGLGTEGPHPYLVGESAGHTMLDAVRAAAQVDGSGVDAVSPVLLWGFSQGGQAALFAAEQAPSYAPELDVVAVAAVAPVGDARQFWDRAVARTDQVGVAATMAYGLAASDPALDVREVLTDGAIAELGRLEDECIGDVVEAFAGSVDDVVRRPVDEAPSWAAALDANTSGRRPIGVPVLLVQGGADDIVYPGVGDALADRLCAQGAVLEYRRVPEAGHGDIPPASVVGWLTARLAGEPAPTTCPQEPMR